MANDTSEISEMDTRRGRDDLVAFRLPGELRDAIKAEAAERSMSVSAFIRQSLTETIAGRRTAA